MTMSSGASRTDPSGLDASDGVLSMREVTKRFGQTVALDAVSLTLRPGEVVALLGENGAGKSTVANILDGVLSPDDGEVTIDGRPYRPKSPADALRAGIGVVHQEISVVPTLSVAENLFLGQPVPSSYGLINRRRLARDATKLLASFELDKLVDPWRSVGSLSVPMQQLVAIAKVLHRQARFIILDEPTAAFSGEESELLFNRIAELRRRGVPVIYITHRLDEIRQVATRAVVLRDGRVVAEHDAVSTPVETLVRDMVGRPIGKVFPAKIVAAPSSPILEVRGLSSDGQFRDVNFGVFPGEIFGIAGLVGTGRSEILHALGGSIRTTSGSILLDGQAVVLGSPGEAIGHGIVLSPEDRKTQGLLLGQSVRDNLALPVLPSFVRRGLLSFPRMREHASKLAERMTVRGGGIASTVGRLSGGNQQKVLLGRCLAVNPRVLLLDEPTRGVDVGARAAIYEHLVALACTGVAIIMVSSELEELLGICHRIGIMRKDRRFGGVVGGDVDQATIMQVVVAVDHAG